MRSEHEILDLIIHTAKNDNRIRAVIMNGSRANPNAPRDFFQDFDIVFFVTETAPFVRNFDWIKRFGKLMILQTPEDMQDHPPGEGEFYSYLMQFTDGTRIDLGILPISKIKERTKDSLSLLLLDKDGIIPHLPPPSEQDYLPKPPTEKAFNNCCNEFWWVCPYAAKGLWRREIIYAKHMLDDAVREQLNKMLNWYIGIKTGFKKNPGKCGKYYERYLEPELWHLLLRTYADAGYENTWEAMFAMCDLFRKLAIPVADQFDYQYPYKDDHNVCSHLRHVYTLPGDASEMY